VIKIRVLCPENLSFDMNDLPNQVDDLRYFVLDYGNQDDVDFYAIPLFFLDVFSRPAADLKIGPYRITMPLDWSVVITDRDFGYLEVIELAKLNDREFDVFALNPIAGYLPEFYDISIQNIFPDFSWNMPRLKFGHLLVVPLSDKPNPPCALFVKDTNKLPDILDITKVFS
jgi:hypothetical protein